MSTARRGCTAHNARDFDTTAHFKLAIDAVDVGPHRTVSNPEPRRDLAVGAALSNQRCDVALSGGKAVEGCPHSEYTNTISSAPRVLGTLTQARASALRIARVKRDPRGEVDDSGLDPARGTPKRRHESPVAGQAPDRGVHDSHVGD